MVNRAQSESIGVILLVGVVVISVGTFGTVFLLNFTDDPGPVTAIAVDIGPKNLTLTHDGGSTLPESEVVVIVDGASRNRSALTDLDPVRRDGDGVFEPGERWQTNHNVSSGGAVEVLVIHEPSNEVLYNDVKQVPEG